MRAVAAFVSIGLAGALAACATPPPAPTPVAAAPAPAAQAQASGGLDGVYRAPPEGVHGSSACGTTVFRSAIHVANGVASIQTVAGGRFEGKVAPDGSLSIEEGVSSLRGQFSPGQFNGTYSRNRCGFILAYKK